MSSLMRWDPFSELVSLRETMDRLFEESFGRPRGAWPTIVGMKTFPVDMYETKDNVVVKATLPGVEPEDVDITLTGDTLTIKGEVKPEEEEVECYICQERRHGTFSRSLILPTSVVADKAEAEFENGILTLTIPKAEEVKAKSIKIKTK
ncbi:MAG: Hsp20/alpha crystallin family protein [Anaerolineae bacterium]